MLNKPFKLIQDTWNWLDGKKTNIATALFVFGQILDYFYSSFMGGIWHHAAPVALPQIIASINWFASLLGGTGLIHKAAKQAAAMGIPESKA